MKKYSQPLLFLISLVAISYGVPEVTQSSGVCPDLACTSLLSPTTCISTLSAPATYTFFQCASGLSCGSIAADGDFFLDVPSGAQSLAERDCSAVSTDGAPCTSNVDCETLNCSAAGVCISGIKAENEFCTNTLQCSGESLQCLGQVLGAPESLCVPRLQDGQGPCTSSTDCVTGLWCDSTDTQLCLQKRANAKACLLDQQCQLGYCDRKACRPNLTLMGVGGPCTTAANCKTGLVCLDLKRNSNTELGQDGVADTCGAPLADTEVGCLQDSDCVGSAICVDLIDATTGAADTPDGQYADTCSAALIPFDQKGCILDSHCDNGPASTASFCVKTASPYLCGYKQVTGTACQADYYCLSNICVNSVCVSNICNQHADCPVDLNGVAQYCDLATSFMCNPVISAAVLEGNPAAYAGTECALSYQCLTGHYCDTTITAETPKAVCKPADAATGSACLDDEQCSTAGDMCISGTCQSGMCRANSDCTGQYCDTGDNTCKAFIAQGAACTNDLHCDTAVDFCDIGASDTCLQQLAILANCERDAQCSGDKICLNNQCEEFKCQTDNDCDATHFCDTSKNLCLNTYTSTVGAVCETDKYCRTPNQCLTVALQGGGTQLQCRSETCSNDAHCKGDATAQYCDLTVNYCKFRTDRNDPCTTDSECSSSDPTDVCFWGNCRAVPTCLTGYYYNSGLFACVEQRADGGACDRNEACTSNLCVSSTCATAKADGTACPLAHNDECTNICAYQVATSTYKCSAQLTAGSTTYHCNDDADCVGYDTNAAKCIILSGQTKGLCKVYPQAGDSCTATEQCPSDHSCEGTDTCTQYTEQLCTQDLDCQSGELCLDLDYEVTIEEGGDKCQTPLTTEFAHCIKQEHCNNSNLYCSLADSAIIQHRQCLQLKADSSACAANYECESTYCIANVCEAVAAADGSACEQDADCASASWCESLVCKARIASGGACVVGTDKCLETNESCLANDNSGSNFSCSELHIAGEYCGSNSDCEASTLYCNGASQCEARRTDYATCGGSDLCEQSNYKCETLSSVSKCIAPLTSGSCVDDTTCATGYFCSSASQCTAYITSVGSSCSGADERCWETLFCGSGNGNTCLQKYTKQIGEVADNALECKSGRSIFTRCIRLKVVSERVTLSYPYPCNVGSPCQYISDDAAQFDIENKDCVCSGSGSSMGFCPIVAGVPEYDAYTAAYLEGAALNPPTAASNALTKIVYEHARHSLLQNCAVRDCLKTVDPNWPTAVVDSSELSTICTVNQSAACWLNISVFGVLLAIALII